MARLSNATMTMLMCLALLAACLRHNHRDTSVAQVVWQSAFVIDKTDRHSEAFYDHFGAEETTNATIVNTSAFRTSIIESENEMDIKRAFKHGQASEDFELEGDGEGLIQPADRSKEQICLGKVRIVPNGLCEYLKTGTEIAVESFRHCRTNPRSPKCRKPAKGYRFDDNQGYLLDTDGNPRECGPSDPVKDCRPSRAYCDPSELNAAFKDPQPVGNYQPVEIIYSGKFGIVVKVEVEKRSFKEIYEKAGYGEFNKGENGTHVLLAKLTPPTSKEADEPFIQREASLCSQVPKMYETWDDSAENQIFIQDYVRGRDFFDYVKHTREKGEMHDVVVFKLFRQLADTVRRLHERENEKIVHRDIKIQNMKWDGKTLWLLDFGFAKRMTPNSGKARRQIGTLGYAAPEIYLQSKFLEDHGYNATNGYDEKVDIFAMGVVLYYLFFGRFPWDPEGMYSEYTLERAIQRNNGMPYFQYLETNIRGRWTQGSFDTAKELMQNMLAINSGERPSAGDVLELMGDLGRE